MKLWLGLLVLITAAAISCVAAYFSVVGLVALFAASAVPVMIMGGILEWAKLIGSGWLKFNWNNKNANWKLRYGLLTFIINLMIITSIGIYGFLMAGHLDQAAPRADIQVQSSGLQVQLDQKTQDNQRLQQRLNQIDQNISVFLHNNQGAAGLRASQSLQRERTQIQHELETNNQSINQLNTQLAPLHMQSNEVEAKLGPVKYFARLLGLPEDDAVQIVIVLIMIPFDPLAVALLLAGLQTLREYFEERKAKKETPAIEQPLEPVSGDPLPVPVIEAEIEDRSDYERAHMADEIAVDIPAEQPKIDEEVETLSRLAGLRPEAERGFVAEAIPMLEPEPVMLDEHVEDELDHQPIDPKEVDRDTLISILERHPGILNEIEEMVEEDVAHDLTDREKLLDLLEKNPTIINDMAEIIAAQITKGDKPLGDSWLKD